MWPSVSGFYQSHNVFKAYLCWSLCEPSIPCCGWIILHSMARPPSIYLFISWLNIWAVSTLWLLWVMLLWTFVYKFLHGHMFSCLLGIDLWVELLGHIVTLCLILRERVPFSMEWSGEALLIIWHWSDIWRWWPKWVIHGDGGRTCQAENRKREGKSTGGVSEQQPSTLVWLR